MTQQQKLRERLNTIWKPPDLFTFFKAYAKRPAHLVKKGTVLFNVDDPLPGIYFVQKGFIKLYRVSEEGKETVIYLIGPGNILGLRALISESESARHYTEAITDVEIVMMTRKEYLEILEAHPEHLIDLLHAFIERLNSSEARLKGFIAANTTSRVAYFLLDCTNRFTPPSKEKVEIPLPLTHERIAEFVGSFRETVTLSLHTLTKEKIIQCHRGVVTVLSRKKLQSFVDLEKY